MEICYIFFGCLGFIVFLYLVLEFHYFVRGLTCIIWAAVCKKKQHVLEETTIHSICFLTDIDGLLNHMNNARFLRELDFAKLDFYQRTGLYKKIKSLGGSVYLVATTIRYRRFIKVFQRYCITSRIIYWDSQHVYMEHRFITPSEKFINAIVMCKLRFVNCNAEDILAEMIGMVNHSDDETAKSYKPQKSLELEKWIESNEISSAVLRSSDETVKGPGLNTYL